MAYPCSGDININKKKIIYIYNNIVPYSIQILCVSLGREMGTRLDYWTMPRFSAFESSVVVFVWHFAIVAKFPLKWLCLGPLCGHRNTHFKRIRITCNSVSYICTCMLYFFLFLFRPLLQRNSNSDKVLHCPVRIYYTTISSFYGHLLRCVC